MVLSSSLFLSSMAQLNEAILSSVVEEPGITFEDLGKPEDLNYARIARFHHKAFFTAIVLSTWDNVVGPKVMQVFFFFLLPHYIHLIKFVEYHLFRYGKARIRLIPCFSRVFSRLFLNLLLLVKFLGKDFLVVKMQSSSFMFYQS